MSNLNGIEIYFLINMAYTLVLFFFFHNKIIRMVIKRSEKPIENIVKFMNTYYIINVFLGSFSLVLDFLHCLCDPKECLWLRKEE